MNALSIREFDSTPESARQFQRRLANPERPRLRIPSLDIEVGKCHALIGKSGAGKTVLNSLLLGFPASRLGHGVQLEQMDWWNGLVSVHGADFRKSSKLLAKWHIIRKRGTLLYLPQILPDGRGYQMSVRTYLSQVLPALRRQSGDLSPVPNNPFGSFPKELKAVLDNPVTRLSGGERRRIELWARMTVLEALPKDRLALLVLDEPTTGLDVPDERRYLTELRQKSAELPNLAILVTTHALYFLDDHLPGKSGKPLFDSVFLVHKDATTGSSPVPSCRVTSAVDSDRLCHAVMERTPGKSVEDSMEDFVNWQAGLTDDEFEAKVEKNYFGEYAQ